MQLKSSDSDDLDKKTKALSKAGTAAAKNGEEL
jgi:hypothetical protein